MKIVAIILLGCVGYTVAAFTPFDAFSSIYKQTARMKRDASSDPGQCFAACVEAMELELGKKIRDLDIPLQEPTSLTEIVCLAHNPTLFNAACSVYGKYHQCLTVCPNDQYKAMALKALQVSKFMCVDRYEEFQQYLPCIYSTCDAARSICEHKCRPFESKIENDANGLSKSDNDEENFKNVINMISEVCGYVDCTMECLYSQYTDSCGKYATNLEKELMEKTLEAVAEYTDSLVSNFPWPASCQKLHAHTFYKIEY